MAAWVCLFHLFYQVTLYVQTVKENDLITAQMICGLTKCTTARLQTPEEVMWELFFKLSQYNKRLGLY